MRHSFGLHSPMCLHVNFILSGFILLLVLTPHLAASASASANQAWKLREKTEGRLLNLATKGGSAPAPQLEVVVEVATEDRVLVGQLEAMGFEVESFHNKLIQIRTTPQELAKLADLDFVIYVRLPAEPIVLDVVSEGVSTIGADKVQQAGMKGIGVKTAVLDVGFDVQNSEIASNIAEARSFRRDRNIQGARSEDTAHGTAVSEIIVDVAPGVRLYLMNFNTEVEYLNAVDYAIQLGVSIISTSIGWANVGPLDGTSDISKTADLARGKGIVFVSAGGNEARRHWSGTFRDVNGDGILIFQGTDQQNTITVRTGQRLEIFLSWDDWPRSTQDYDLFLLDNSMNLVASSQTIQAGLAPPAEQIILNQPTPGTYHIEVKKSRATRNVFFQLFVFTQDLQYFVPEGSIVVPGDARGAITVGATYYANDSLEVFSSRGPTVDGRIKPDLTGPDGVSTSAFGLRAFFGSSASAPHVSGAAAMVLGNSTIQPDSLQQLLESTAKDLGPPGKDNSFGSGRVDVYAATRMSDFEITLTPSNQTAFAGSTAAYSILLRSINGYERQITLTIFGLPISVTATITPNPVFLRSGSQQSAVLSIKIGNGTNPGKITFQMIGGDGQRSHTVNGALLVLPSVTSKLKLIITTNPRVADVPFKVDGVEYKTNLQGSFELPVDRGAHTIALVKTIVTTSNRSLTFTSWSGGASGYSNPLTVNMTKDTTVTANFALIIPGFPVESILVGISAGLIALVFVRRRTRLAIHRRNG